MWKKITTIAIILALASLAMSKMVIKGSPTATSRFWLPSTTPHASTPMKLFVALKERNLHVLEERLAKTSDPTSPEYGKHLSFEEVTQISGATDEQIEAVSAWLKAHGIEHEVTPSRSFMRINSNAGRMENLLNCNLRYYQSSHSNKKIIRCAGSYSVPEDIHPLIDFVGPVHGFPRPRRTRVKGPVAFDEQAVTPDLIHKLYNVTLGYPNFKVNNTQAVFEAGDNYMPSDVQQFFQTYAPALQGQKILKHLGNEQNDPTNPGEGEAILDVEYIMSIGSFAPTYYYAYDDSDDVIKLFLEYAMDLANDPKPPLIHSISYGEYGGNYPIEHVLRVSNEWMKLGTRGVSIFVASGDDGVGCDDSCDSFEFPYPSSPYITLVGGTDVYKDDKGRFYEIGWDGSSGGFSGDFPVPSWQAAQIAAYLQQPGLPTSYFNGSGRGLPDISAPADNVMIIMGGSQTPIGGTSCAAPVIAGLFSLINGVRLKAGKTSVGFINPAIYTLSSQNPNAFYDVTQGSNPDGCCPGFPATKGWDAVTGLGTPNFRELLKYFSQLP
jgi:tripeptidyl-peptidase-1